MFVLYTVLEPRLSNEKAVKRAGQVWNGTVQHGLFDPLFLLEVFRKGNTIPASPMTWRLQSSQIVSKSRSPRLSAPQTLHLFRLSRAPKTTPKPLVPRTMLLGVGDSTLLLRCCASPLLVPSASSSAAALSRASFSISRAASSASGESGIVSREEMLGERDRNEVGVEGIEEEEKEMEDG